MRPITERTIKFTSNALEIMTDYEKDTQILFSGEGEIRSVEDTTNSDGTDRRKYKLEPLSVELQQLEFPDKVKWDYALKTESAKPKTKSKSQKLREVLFIFWQQEFSIKYKDFDVYYDAAMDKIIDEVKGKLI